MKKILFYFLVIYNSILLSQVPYYYYPVTSGTTNNLYDIRNISTMSNGFYVCGDNGTLLKLKHPDSTCLNVISNTTTKLNGIIKNYFGSYYPYMIFGNNGIVLKSSNGGPWTQQVTGYLNNNLNSGITLYINNYPYWISYCVGTNGIILKRNLFPISLDTNWILVQSNTTNDLKSICPSPRNEYYYRNDLIWISGNNGTIIKSIDTGNTWFQLTSGTTNNLNSIYFLNPDTGFVAGDGGIILKTTNGGVNWIQKISNTTQNLNCIEYIEYNNKSLIISGNKTVLISTDFGENWNIDLNVPQYNLYSCKFYKSDLWGHTVTLFSGENGKIYKRKIDTTYHTNEYASLEANNINSFFIYRGIFDQDTRTTNTPGFEWPKGSHKTALFTAGLSIAAYVNGELREAMASYYGEYRPGYCSNGNYYINDYYKIYKVSKNDNAQNNWDWANWGQMVPYGAPYIDVNNNNIYEPLIDTPGVKNAKETIFLCMTDADSGSHTSGEGFGGGTKPLYAEVHMTAWAYDSPGLQDVQFISYDIINKSTSVWSRVKMGIICDCDLGDANDDFTGCDTTLNMTYCYNGDNFDNIYGENPPAVGITLLVSPLNRSITPNKRLGVTSSAFFGKSSGPPCESDPNGQPYEAYLMLSGYKKDSTCWLDPTFNPPKKTKFCYSGDPETNIGWTFIKGYIGNCNLDSTGTIMPGIPNDRRFYFASGADNFNIIPGESQKFVIAQLIACGTSNLNSVTRLKQLCDSIRNFYSTNFPIGINNNTSVIPKEYKLFQNYPNPFNPSTNIKFQIKDSRFVTLKVYDILGREIETLVNEKMNAGTYEVPFSINQFSNNQLSSGVYFYKLVAGDYTETKKMLLIK